MKMVDFLPIRNPNIEFCLFNKTCIAIANTDGIGAIDCIIRPTCLRRRRSRDGAGGATRAAACPTGGWTRERVQTAARAKCHTSRKYVFNMIEDANFAFVLRKQKVCLLITRPEYAVVENIEWSLE
jgi:hypothetical protein